MEPVRVVGLGGSLHAPSNSLAALRIALEGAREAGAEVELMDIRELDLLFYQPGLVEVPPAVEPKAWQVFDHEGHARDRSIDDQLRALGREVARAARQLAAEPALTTPDVTAAEEALQPLADAEVA